MRTTCVLVGLSLLLAGRGWAASEIESKVAVVDMEKVMAAHPETQEAEALLQKQAAEFDAEKDDMLAKFDRLKKEFEVARDGAENKALSDEARTAKRELAEDKLAALRDFDNEVRQTTVMRQKQLADRKHRMRDRIVGKIRDIVRAYANQHGLVLVLDCGAVMDNPGSVLYNAEKMDVTEDILKIVSLQKVNREELTEKTSKSESVEKTLKSDLIPARASGAAATNAPARKAAVKTEPAAPLQPAANP